MKFLSMIAASRILLNKDDIIKKAFATQLRQVAC
jgi:hypothetical protein